MRFKKITSTLLLVFVGLSFLSAQVRMKTALNAYEDLDYYYAIENFKKVLEDSDNAEAKIKLADCYRKVSDPIEAEYWYGQVVRLAESEPVHKLFYGQMLQRNGKCDLAQEWYNKYVEEVPDDIRGQHLVKACEYEDYLLTKNAGIYEVIHLPFNGEMDDFSPMVYEDQLIFASEVKVSGPVDRKHGWTGNPFTQLMVVDAQLENEETYEYSYGEMENFSSKLNSKFHDASCSFADEGSTIYFTRNNYYKGKTGKDDEKTIRLKIFSAKSSGGGSWSDLESMPFNSDEYSVAHPALTPDGQRMYFASDMPGGFGGMDLYVSEYEGGRWGAPINLGASINTEGNEIFPFYDEADKLYFCSDGHIGLGGLDIYHMEYKDGEWGEIINIGAPINTRDDDFGIYINPEQNFGYFTSDRDGGKGRDDIYSFRKESIQVELYVFDEETGEPINGAEVVDDCTGNTLVTGRDGKVGFEMKLNECCDFEASKGGYENNTKQGCSGSTLGKNLVVEIPLMKPRQLEIAGKILDSETNEPIDNAKVELISDCDGSVETLYTDADGSYFFELEDECCYTVKATKIGEYLMQELTDQCTEGKSEPILANLYLKPTVPGPGPGSNVTTTYPNPGGTTTYPSTGTTTYPSTGTTTYPSDPGANRPYMDVNGKYIDPSTGQYYTNSIPDPDGYTYLNGDRIYGQTGGGLEVGPGGYYLVHIYYDFDQSYIRDDAEPELNKLLTIMQNNPEIVVELASHTDSRGSYSYNDRLSQRRAEAVVRWLKSKGVSRNRMRPKGYGENQNVNNCANNVPCSEEEHQWNRRTEFRIVGYYNDGGEYVQMESTRPSATSIDPCHGCPF